MELFNREISAFLTARELYELSRFIPKTRDDYLKYMQVVYNLKLSTPFPLIVHIETTNKCNLHCRMCQHPDMKRAPMDIPDKLAIKAIDECASLRASWFLHFFFFGEPFLNKKTIDYMYYAREMGIENISVTTNFTTISPKELKALVELPLTSITISFEGISKERYKAIRGRDYYLTVKKNIEDLIQYKKALKSDAPWITITYVRTDETDEEIEEFKREWREKVNAIHISPQFDYLGRSQLSRQRSKAQINSERILERDPERRQPCRQLWLRLVVMSNGEIVPCSQNMDGELSLGNIKDMTLHEAWTGERLNQLRMQHIMNKYDEDCVCKRCIDWDWSGRVDKRPRLL